MSKPREIDDIANMIENGEFIGERIEDYDFSSANNVEIEYQGITISSDGLVYGINEYGEITRDSVSIDIIRDIEDAVKSGELSLSEEQRSTLGSS